MRQFPLKQRWPCIQSRVKIHLYFLSLHFARLNREKAKPLIWLSLWYWQSSIFVYPESHFNSIILPVAPNNTIQYDDKITEKNIHNEIWVNRERKKRDIQFHTAAYCMLQCIFRFIYYLFSILGLITSLSVHTNRQYFLFRWYAVSPCIFMLLFIYASEFIVTIFLIIHLFIILVYSTHRCHM